MTFALALVAGSLCSAAVLARPLSAQQYGGSVAAGNGSVFVGETSNVSLPGIVYVYRAANGEWREEGRLAVAAEGERPDGFGRALAASGDEVLVGAPSAEEGRGAAILFRAGNDGEWQEVARLMAADGPGEGNFGAAVALHGDMALVSAPAEDDGAGAVYFFTRDASGEWSQRDRYRPDGDGRGFGSVLAADATTALASTAPTREAAATVHALRLDPVAGRIRSQGQLDPAGWLPAPDQTRPSANRFGSALGVMGETALVGAPGVGQGTGAVMVFAFDSEEGTWMPQSALVAFDRQPRSTFGTSLSLDGGDVWVGAPGSGNGAGSVYHFTRSTGQAGGWTQVRKTTNAALPEGRPTFGSSVAFAGGVGVVGAGGVDSRAGGVVFAQRDGVGDLQWSDLAVGEYRSLPAIAGRDEEVLCAENEAAGFECDNVNIISFLPIKEMAGSRGSRLNDVWGWTDSETGREIAIVGRTDGTAFVDVSDPYNPRMLGNLPKTPGSRSSVWRDMKVYRDHTYIVADGAGEHGVQVFDLRRLRTEGGPDAEFEPDFTYPGIHSAHNIVVNEQTGFAYAVGSSGGGETCGGGLHMLDLDDPSRPVFAGCFAHANTGRRGTGYSHDAQCVIYHGPDEEHQGKEICLGSNETRLSIADVTDKDAPVALASVDYPSVVYAHQGWLTEDHRYFYMNDEGDEPQGLVEGTRTLVWDVMDLDEPVLVNEYIADTPDTDHNLYIRGNLMYQSNYGAGLRILDISDPVEPVEIAYFDTTPWQGGASWSNYPYFESGIIVVTSTGDGLFIVRNTARRTLIP